MARRYGGDDDDFEEREPRRRSYACRGYADPSGHCGAEDCETCHPGAAQRDENSDDNEGEEARP